MAVLDRFYCILFSLLIRLGGRIKVNLGGDKNGQYSSTRVTHIANVTINFHNAVSLTLCILLNISNRDSFTLSLGRFSIEYIYIYNFGLLLRTKPESQLIEPSGHKNYVLTRPSTGTVTSKKIVILTKCINLDALAHFIWVGVSLMMDTETC